MEDQHSLIKKNSHKTKHGKRLLAILSLSFFIEAKSYNAKAKFYFAMFQFLPLKDKKKLDIVIKPKIC